LQACLAKPLLALSLTLRKALTIRSEVELLLQKSKKLYQKRLLRGPFGGISCVV